MGPQRTLPEWASRGEHAKADSIFELRCTKVTLLMIQGPRLRSLPHRRRSSMFPRSPSVAVSATPQPGWDGGLALRSKVPCVRRSQHPSPIDPSHGFLRGPIIFEREPARAKGTIADMEFSPIPPSTPPFPVFPQPGDSFLAVASISAHAPTSLAL